MKRLARVLLRCYPARWRERYGPELADIVNARHLRFADVADLVRGVLDARLHPLLPALQLATPMPPPPLSPPPRAAYGPMSGPPTGQLTRRSFMRRMLGAGVGLLSLEFVGGTLAFLWPRSTGSMGVEHAVGTAAEIIGVAPDWARGRPYEVRAAGAFLVNVRAATAWATGGDEVEVLAPAADELLALWRKCPHLGCMIPEACDARGRFQCYCHQSTYNILGEKLTLGPAPRGMDRFPVRVDSAGVIHVDTREVIAGPPAGVITFRDGWPPGEGCA
jgi:Rieske Fe-S protein